MVKIDQTLCDRCGTCIAVCPKDALVLVERLQVRSEACCGCNLCVRVCPVKALIPEDGRETE